MNICGIRRLIDIRGHAMAALMAVAGNSYGAVTYTFNSPVLSDDGVGDTASFSIELTFKSLLADGTYFFRDANSLPAGFSYQATDGFTTLTDVGDLLNIDPLSLTIANGAFTDFEIYAVDFSKAPDPYYGYTTFSTDQYEGGGSSTQLQDINDPKIVGIDYAGHHIPVANGGAGYWTYPTLTSVPEPSTYALFGAGMSLLNFVLWRRRTELKAQSRSVI